MVVVLFLLLPAPAWSGPIIEVDLDAVTETVEAARSVDVGAQFDVLVRIRDVTPGSGLNAFQLDLQYDESILSAVSIDTGIFLAAPTRVVAQSASPSPARLAVTTVGSGVANGEGVLARVRFEALKAGISPLSVGGMRLAGRFGVTVMPSGAPGAVVTAVPEPDAAVLGVCALLTLIGVAQRRRRSASALPLVLVCLLQVAGQASAQVPEVVLDASGDGFVDVLDVSLVSSCLGLAPDVDSSCAPADIDADSDVDETDLDLVIAAFGLVVGPPFDLPGQLFDCVRDGFPCGLGATSEATVDRMDVILAEVKAQLEEGGSLDDARDFILSQPDSVECFRPSHGLVCRIQDAPPFIIHDGASARLGGNPPAGNTSSQLAGAALGGCCTGPFESGTRTPIGHRVIGRDRDADGRRDRDKTALIIAPFLSQFRSDDSAPIVRAWIDDSVAVGGLPYDDYQGSVNYVTDYEVVLDDFLSFAEYDLIFVSTHGNAFIKDRNGSPQTFQYIEMVRSQASTGAAALASCKAARARVDGLAPGASEQLYCGLTNSGTVAAPVLEPVLSGGPKFFSLLYSNGLENTVIYLDACRTFMFPYLADALMGRHSVFLGWDDYANSFLASSAAEEIFIRAAWKGMRLRRAWQLTCEAGYCVFPSTRAGNDKPEALHFEYDGVDQRIREVVTILDPETLEPAELGSVLVERFWGGLDDGLPMDALGFYVEIEGFEPFDLELVQDPNEFLSRTTMLTADRDGVPLGSATPLTDNLFEPVGPPTDYKWRSKNPIYVGLGMDMSPGDQLDVDVKLRFPPSEDKLPTNPPEIGYSYEQNFTHTIEACAFTATVSGSEAGVYPGILATVGKQGGEWSFDARGPVAFPLPGFSVAISAPLLGDQPGQPTAFHAIIPGSPMRSYSWSPDMVTALGIGPPTITLTSDDGEQIVGTVSGTAVDGFGADRNTVNVNITFDGDITSAVPTLGPCVR